ncbi:helix-turn-helix domain-containing protein [Williamsia sp.]|uniref:TetR/AcrR family transcriptional regulator n=1 Tax=Williamsia sp. TaxID=1872085 RepID=UPI002F946F6D
MSGDTADDLASRIAERSLAKRGANYAAEVRRLLDAALAVMKERGTASRPRVADIVAAAGLSNEAFYRHFSSKDALVAALLEDGTLRLRRYVDHQMNKEPTPERKIRRWVEGVLAQAIGETADTTRAVEWNAGGLGEDSMKAKLSADRPMASLLHEPFTELGSAEPDFDALLASHAVLGMLADYLWRRVEPSAADIDRIYEFCLRTVNPR